MAEDSSFPFMVLNQLEQTIDVLIKFNMIMSKGTRQAGDSWKKAALEDLLQKTTKDEKDAIAKILEAMKEAESGMLPEKPKQYEVSGEVDAGKVLNHIREVALSITFAESAENFVREMSVVYLIAKFEDYLQRVLTWAVWNKPDILRSKAKSLTFEQVLDYKDREELVGVMAEKEMDDLFREDLDMVSQRLKEKFGVALEDIRGWPEFRELYYRRNLIVHNDSVPNAIYRRKTGFEGPSERLEISQEYIVHSATLTREVSQEIATKFQRKFSSQREN